MSDQNDIADEIMARERASWRRPIAADGSLVPPPVPAPETPVQRVASTPPLFGDREPQPPTPPQAMPRKSTLTPEERKANQLQYQRERRERLAKEQGREYRPRGQGKVAEAPRVQAFAGGPGKRAQLEVVADARAEGGGNGDPWIIAALASLQRSRAALATQLERMDRAIALLKGE